MVTVYVLYNIGVNKSVSESITEDSHRVNGKFIITIIGKCGSLHHCTHTQINLECIVFLLFSNCSHIIYTLMYMLYNYYIRKQYNY